MFLPAHFRQSDIDTMHVTMRAYPLALLSVIIDGQIEVTQVPVVTENVSSSATKEDQCLRLRFHLARHNHIAKALLEQPDASATIVFTGPNMYISPDWYGTENQVPTWNYATVQARGVAREASDIELCDLLDELSAMGESPLDKKQWTSDKLDDAIYAKMRKVIVGFDIVTSDLQAKWKMNQNRLPDERTSLRKALSDLDSNQARVVRKHIPE